MFRYGMIPTRKTPVTANTTTAINHIRTNVIKKNDFKTGNLKIARLSYR